MRSLDNKIALVTGAASGIGRAVALRLAREGTHLFLLDVDTSGLEVVVASTMSSGVNVRARRCDLRQPEQISASVRELLADWKHLDLLVNNAGIGYYGPSESMSVEAYQEVLAVNLLAPIQLTRELLPTLLGRPEAHILNISSFLGLIGTRKVAAYSASKFGLVGFSESLRAEYARTNLGVTALCPGFVDTELLKKASQGQREKSLPAWTVTTPERIADRAVTAIRRNQGLVVTQAYARLAYFGKRLCPGLIDWANHLSRKRFRTSPRVESDHNSATRRAA